MKESYREGIANDSGPEPCKGSREAALEVLDRGICRLGIELRKEVGSGSRWCRIVRRQQSCGALMCERPAVLRSRRPQACRETPCARTERPRSRPRAMSGPEGERDEQ